ncbi:MAG: hypothetical protein E4H44_01035 [Candidatus Aminicenantes bacterium]|nr:MAG: hypothetical protein E4H44_01035 [Candidatus Aminicenantes bacterium]
MSAGRGGGLRLVLVLAVVIRLALLAGNFSDHPDFFFQDLNSVEANLSSTENPYMNPFGFEASNIAHALVCGNQGLASPFGGSTGPTAWIAPGVVALYALSFSLWGCFTFESILFVFFIALGCSVVTTIVVFRIGSRIGRDTRVGLLAALFFACLPFEAWIFKISGHLDFNLQVMWFAVLLLGVLVAADSENPHAGLGLGSLAAVAALFNPVFFACAAVGAAFAIRGKSLRDAARFVAQFAAACAVIAGPYVVVQSIRLGGFVPVKSNAGFELFLGNTPEARGLFKDEAFRAHHPSQNVDEFKTYAEFGEFAYVEEARRRFEDSFRPLTFFKYTVRRTFYFLFGYDAKPWDHSSSASAVKAALWTVPMMSVLALLAIRRGRLQSAEILVLLYTLAFAFPYLLTGVMERHRIPVVTTVAVALALVTQELKIAWRRSRRGRPA